MKTEALPRVLRNLAAGTNARAARHDIVLNAAAAEIERLRSELLASMLAERPVAWRTTGRDRVGVLHYDAVFMSQELAEGEARVRSGIWYVEVEPLYLKAPAP